MQSGNFMQQYLNIPSLVNYKNVKCFYFERDNYCKYGKNCQYAHSDGDIKTTNEISYLNSIATAINYDLNMAYGDSVNCSVEETQNRVNDYMQSMIGHNQAMESNTVSMNNPVSNYNYVAYGNNNSNSNNYDYSYTPDTNYGDNYGGTGANYYDQYQDDYTKSPYIQYPQYSQYGEGYNQNVQNLQNNYPYYTDQNMPTSDPNQNLYNLPYYNNITNSHENKSNVNSKGYK